MATGHKQIGSAAEPHATATRQITGGEWWGAGLRFAGRSGKLSGFSKLKAELDKASGVSDWRLHDLRRTAATNMQELGIRNEVVQSILNHAVPGVGGVYLRSELEKQKGAALALWPMRSLELLSPEGDRMRCRPTVLDIRKFGKSLKSEASILAERLAESGADASRLFEADDASDYCLEPPVCISARVADLILAVLVGFAPGPLGRPPKPIYFDCSFSQRLLQRVSA